MIKWELRPQVNEMLYNNKSYLSVPVVKEGAMYKLQRFPMHQFANT